MKKFNFTFYLIKVLVLLLINLMCFAVSLILHLIFKPAGNPALTALISSAAGGAVFLMYTFKTAASLKNPDALSPARFAAREGVCYAVFMLIPLVLSLIFGAKNLTDYAVMLFFLPNTLFFYLTKNAFLGYLLHTALYTAVVTASLLAPKGKHNVPAAKTDENAASGTSGESTDDNSDGENVAGKDDNSGAEDENSDR
ncbi:MAG: hypothetical protein WCQ72_03740 [Eubacteriales bacterium]